MCASYTASLSINKLRPGTPSLRASRSIPDHGKACFTEMHKLAIFLNGSNMSISPCRTFHFALTVVSCHSTMPHLKGSRSCTVESNLVLVHPQAGTEGSKLSVSCVTSTCLSREKGVSRNTASRNDRAVPYLDEGERPGGEKGRFEAPIIKKRGGQVCPFQWNES
ncbi:MAG: hypothetical protein A4E65_00739 [Syntrophorhabdus sp. PtaU1.Bin153]|nr:MAG: hypothetical protein A4E65_00739 [Syntrophorhabdus sp. PtaU1.Bin153]